MLKMKLDSASALASAKWSFVILVALASGTTMAIAGPTRSCVALKQHIKASGSYLYHFADLKNPDVKLYRLYVTSDLKCDAGEELDEKAVPSLPGCTVPTCADMYGLNLR